MSDTEILSVMSNSLLAPLVLHVRPKIVQAILGIGRSKLYEEIGNGKLDAVKDGNQTLITTKSILAYQEKRPAAVIKAPPPPRFEGLTKLHAAQRAKAAGKRKAKARA